MNKVKRVIDYINHMQIPLVWTFGNCTVTLTPTSHNKLSLVSDCENVTWQKDIFDENDSILALVLAVARCTVTVIYDDGSRLSEYDAVSERITYILRAPADIDKVAGWLIDQYEAGNKLPLISRVQVILGNMGTASMSFYEEDKKVCAYYREHVSAELFDNAFNAMSAARTSIVKLSSMAPRSPTCN